MTKINKGYAFEDVPQRLPDGTQFLALRDAIARWDIGFIASQGTYHFDHRILYELPRGQFVFADYGPCTPDVESIADQDQLPTWVAESDPELSLLEPAEAIDVFLFYWPDDKLPDSLQATFNELSKEQSPIEAVNVRPLEYWSKMQKRPACETPAHVAATLEFAVVLRMLLLRFKQVLVTWKPGFLFPCLGLLNSVTEKMIGAYPVDPARWPGKRKAPKTVDLSRLPWSEHLVEVGECLSVIQHVLELPLKCFASRRLPPDSPYHPTREEIQLVTCTLRNSVGPLMELLPELRRRILIAEQFEEVWLQIDEMSALQKGHVDSKKVTQGETYRPSDIPIYASWQYAMKNMPVGKKRPTWKAAYNWLKEHGFGGDEGCELPEFHSWRRQASRLKKFIESTGMDPTQIRETRFVDQDDD